MRPNQGRPTKRFEEWICFQWDRNRTVEEIVRKARNTNPELVRKILIRNGRLADTDEVTT